MDSLGAEGLLSLVSRKTIIRKWSMTLSPYPVHINLKFLIKVCVNLWRNVLRGDPFFSNSAVEEVYHVFRAAFFPNFELFKIHYFHSHFLASRGPDYRALFIPNFNMF